MTVAAGSLGRRADLGGTVATLGGALRSVLAFAIVVLVIAVVWEAAKFVAGVPWREVAGVPLNPPHDPPLRITQLSDLNLPHVWRIAGAFFEPPGRATDFPLGALLIDAALFTWRGAALGFVLGAIIGLALAIVFVHSRLLERALVPYVVASQTVPIIALAPMVVLWIGSNERALLSVAVISAYLTFFPVTIAGIRGLSSPDPRALELMRSYAAGWWSVLWKVRFPASLPYLFTALKISATASVVGAIVAEAPTGINGGLGRAIIVFNLQYASGPQKLWATVIACAALGIAFFCLVRVVEMLVLRGRERPAETA